MAPTAAAQASAYYTKLINYPVRVNRYRGRLRYSFTMVKPGPLGLTMFFPSDWDYLDKRAEEDLLTFKRNMDAVNAKREAQGYTVMKPLAANSQVVEFYSDKYKIPFLVRRQGHSSNLGIAGDTVILTVGKYTDALSEDFKAWIDKAIQPFLPRLQVKALTTTEQIRAMTRKYADEIGKGKKLSSIQFGHAQTYYGSCSSSGRIRYNKLILFAPPELAEAVVVHEVAHLIFMNHAPEFLALCRDMMPDYDSRIKAFDSYMADLGKQHNVKSCGFAGLY